MSTFIPRAVARFAFALVAAAWLPGQAVAAIEEPKPASPAPKAPASSERIAKLVRQLGDKDYYVRQRAQDELASLGLDAIEALEVATTDEDAEIAARARYLLRLMRVEWTMESDPPEVKKCLRDYESLDARSREARMRTLAGLPDAKGVAALCRLVRFDKSSQLSKTAATALLLRGKTANPPCPAAIEIVHKSLQGCKRPGAVWLLTWTRLAADPQAAMAAVAKARRCRVGRAAANARGVQPRDCRLSDSLPGGLAAEARQERGGHRGDPADWPTWSPATRSRWPICSLG